MEEWTKREKVLAIFLIGICLTSLGSYLGYAVAASTRAVTPDNIVLIEDLENITKTSELPFSNITSVPGIGSYSFLISANDPVAGNYSARYPNGTMFFTSTNSTLVEQQTCTAATAGVIQLNNVAWQYSNATIPTGVIIQETLNGQLRKFGSPLDITRGYNDTWTVNYGNGDGYHTATDNLGIIRYANRNASYVINSAIQAMPAYPRGGVLYIQGGPAYSIDSPIKIRGALTIIGDSFYGTTLIQTANIPTGLLCFDNANNELGFALRDMVLDGVYPSNTQGNGIYTTTSGGAGSLFDVNIEHVWFYRFPFSGLNITSTHTWTIKDVCSEFNNIDGLYLRSPNCNVIFGKYDNNTDNGIDFAATDTTIESTHCMYNGKEGIFASGSWYNCRIISNNVVDNGGNYATNTVTGISVSGLSQSIISGNTIDQPSYGVTKKLKYGIYLSSSTSNILIDGNTLNTAYITTKAVKSDSNNNIRITNNLGYNPCGLIATPILATGAYIQDGNIAGSTATWANNTAYTVQQSPKTIVYSATNLLLVQVNSQTLLSYSGTITLNTGDTFLVAYSDEATFTTKVQVFGN